MEIGVASQIYVDVKRLEGGEKVARRWGDQITSGGQMVLFGKGINEEIQK